MLPLAVWLIAHYVVDLDPFWTEIALMLAAMRPAQCYLLPSAIQRTAPVSGAIRSAPRSRSSLERPVLLMDAGISRLRSLLKSDSNCHRRCLMRERTAENNNGDDDERQMRKAEQFHALHIQGIPHPLQYWDAGSARAVTARVPRRLRPAAGRWPMPTISDGEHFPLAARSTICGVSSRRLTCRDGGFESGYGDAPEKVGETVSMRSMQEP